MNHLVALSRKSGRAHKVAHNSPATARYASVRLVLAVACGLCAVAGAIPTHAQNTYRDPAGNFTVQVPQGWKTQPQEGNGVSVVNEQYKASVSVFVMRGQDSSTPSAEKQLADIRKQVQSNCPNGNVQMGDSSILGLHGRYSIDGCQDSDDEVLKFVVVSGPGVMVILNTAAPKGSLGAVGQTLMSIERSVTLGSGSTASSQSHGDSRRMDSQHTMVSSNDPNWDPNAGSSGQSGNSGMYRDNQGRFSLVVPDGWNATPESDGSGTLQLSHGNSWATVALMQGAGDSASRPVDIAHAILQDLQPRYQQAQLVSEGDFENNRHAAHGSNATGIDSHGARVSVTVISIQERGLSFLSVVSSAPEAQADEINGQVLQMVKSIRFPGE